MGQFKDNKILKKPDNKDDNSGGSEVIPED
jgi:hypothetical protein